MRLLKTLAVLLCLIAIAGWATMPPKLADAGIASVPESDLDRYLAVSEQATPYPLIPGTEKRIRWMMPGEKTDYVVVNFPGFSATRQESAPAAERIAMGLNANLFETRWTGHGRSEGALVDVSAEAWLADAVQALQIASRLGERIVIVSSSTGGTLAMAIADHPAFEKVEFVILMSPNFGTHSPNAKWLTRPFGPWLARLTMGETRSWTPHNELQGKYWSTQYPTAAVVEVVRLLDYVYAKLPMSVGASILTLLSPNDTVVSPIATRAALERVSAERMRLLEIESVGDPSNHILAGDILSPDGTDWVVGESLKFVNGH